MKKRYFISLFAAFCLLTGCIRDDRSECTCDVFLSFLYMGDGETDIFPEKIDQVNLYVYSASDNSLAGEYVLDESTLDQYQGMHLHLFPGEYRIVCWGNVFDRTQVDKTHGSAKVAEPVWFRSESFTGTDPLYFSSVDISVPETLQDVNETCIFESSHIKMMVRLKGFKGAVIPGGNVSAVSLSHTGCPAYTDFSNTPAEEKCTVTPAVTEDPDDENSFILKYNVLRFKEKDEMEIAVDNAVDGSRIYSLSLPDFIRENDIEVDNRQEVTVAIQLTATSVGVDVIEWNTEEVDPGFDKE